MEALFCPHLPTIIIAWNIDPFYASKFAISYRSIILVNFYTFCYSFIQLTRAGGFIFAIKGNSILKRTQVGVLVRRIPADDGNNQFRFPRAIAVHPVTGRVYVADTGNHRIKVLDADLNILSHYKNGQFDRPHDISLAMVGNNVQMRVTDFPNNQHRTQIFTVDGIVRTIGDGRNGQRQVSLPTSVAVDLPKPFIVLVNRHNGIVKKVYFTQQKTIRGENFQLNTPEGIAVHPVTGSVYVADTDNNKIKILDVDLTHLQNYPPHEGDDVLNQPHDVSFVEDDNNVYMFVANHGNDRILAFTANIQHLDNNTIQMEGEAGGQPTSIAFHNYLFVVGRHGDNPRVSRLRLSGGQIRQ